MTTTTTVTHTPHIARWTDKTLDLPRKVTRHKCSCGHKDPVRRDIRESEHDQRAHQKEVGV